MKILDVPQSGSTAGTTSSRNRFGQYRRTRAVPVNPNTPAQTDMRAALTALSQTWKTLTAPQMDAWTMYAAAKPRVDSLGQSIVLSGLQMYIGVSSLLMMAGQAPVSDPPSIAQMIDPPTLAAGTLTTVSFTLGYTPTPIIADQSLLIYGSPPKSPGTFFNRDFRFLASQVEDDVAPIALAGPLVTKWGTLAVGQAFFFRAKLLDITTGCFSGWSNVIKAVVGV